MEDIVIVSAVRTPVAKFGGSLAKVSAPELGAIVIKEALARAQVGLDQVGEVIMGQVLTAGVGQNPARQAMMKAGVAKETPALTINAVCGSGLKAVMLAAQAVATGDSEIVVAGGQENMSMSPHVLQGSRDGQRMGDWKMQDTMIVDGLWDVYNQYHMGITAENVAKEHGITRAQQDELAIASQTKAAAAQGAGKFKDEIRVRTGQPPHQQAGQNHPDVGHDIGAGEQPSRPQVYFAGLQRRQHAQHGHIDHKR